MITYHSGEIFKAPINILIHSCNCFNTMGAGIAKDIKLKYPRAYQADCLTVRGDKRKLGQFSVALAGPDQPFTICNIYSQHRYGRDKQYVELDKFLECLENVSSWVKKMNILNPVIGINYKISCNNAGGNWEKDILPRIKYVFESDKEIKVLICKKD